MHTTEEKKKTQWVNNEIKEEIKKNTLRQTKMNIQP